MDIGKSTDAPTTSGHHAGSVSRCSLRMPAHPSPPRCSHHRVEGEAGQAKSFQAPKEGHTVSLSPEALLYGGAHSCTCPQKRSAHCVI